MIVKPFDATDPNIERLKGLLDRHDLPPTTRSTIKRDLAAIKRGSRGEADVAFLIDPLIKDHPNRVILHNLRVVHDDETAQIDHLLINRSMAFYILESKNYRHGLRINEHGEFEYWNGKAYCGMASPIEQAKRQQRILMRVLKASDLLPKRLGFTIEPHWFTRILVGPQTRIVRPKSDAFDTTCVVKADAFMTQYMEANSRELGLGEAMSNLARTVSKDVIIAIARGLLARHVPAEPISLTKYQLPAEAPAAEKAIETITATSPTQREAPPSATEPELVVATNQAAEPASPPEAAPHDDGENAPHATSPTPVQPPVCPRCGDRMVLRTAKKGANAGNQFWGCPRYPKCRQVVAIA